MVKLVLMIIVTSLLVVTNVLLIEPPPLPINLFVEDVITTIKIMLKLPNLPELTILTSLELTD